MYCYVLYSSTFPSSHYSYNIITTYIHIFSTTINKQTNKQSTTPRVRKKMSSIDVSFRRRVAVAAQSTADELISESKIVTNNIPNQATEQQEVQQISWSDVNEQMIVGIGGFSRVNQVTIDNHPSLADQSFALKSLKRNVMEDETFFLDAAKDLSAEAVILSKVKHPNIVNLHAVSEGGPHKAFTETKRGYFLVLDLLDDTLENKLEKQRKCGGRTLRRTKLPTHTRSITLLSSSIATAYRARNNTTTAEVFDRVQNVAIGLSKGLAHLHKNNVVLRDLKPDNIGFDSDGTVKIFDLGFAREIHTIEHAEVCGTLRYMAPEIMRGEKYSTAADVYSFGIVLWELCTLQKPFERCKNASTFVEQVANHDLRPCLRVIENAVLRALIEECWHPDPTKRPDMARVSKTLCLQVGRYAGIISPIERQQGQFSKRMITRSQSFNGPIDWNQGPSEVSRVKCTACTVGKNNNNNNKQQRQTQQQKQEKTTPPSSPTTRLSLLHPSKVGAFAISSFKRFGQHAGPFLHNKGRNARKVTAAQQA